MTDLPQVFISYSHDSPSHKDAVVKLASDLRASGARVVIDRDELFPTQGWPLWMTHQIQQADFVVVVCTEAYQRRAEGQELPPHGAGVSWEGGIIRVGIYEANGRNTKFIPVVLRDEDKAHRPIFLREYSYFLATGAEGYRDLCRVLQLNAAQPPSLPAQLWHIPPPNPYFSGRIQYLADLRSALTTTSQPAALTQAVKGLGGMGKTQTALKYADLHRAAYQNGFHTQADSSASLVSGFAAFGQALGLPGSDDADIARAAAIGKRWFEIHRDWLLILDNVEDWTIARPWIPQSGGHVIVTTRLQNTGTFAHGLHLPNMTPDEGTQFLLDRGKLEHPTEADRAAARSITIEMDGLPLALEQAGAYIEEAKVSPQEYLELYRQEGKALRGRAGDSADHATVSVTFTLALAKLNEAARRVITQAAFLAPDAIPEELLRGTEQSTLEFHDAIAAALRFSLLFRHPASQTIDIHRLVQAVVKDTLEDPLRRTWLESTADQLGRIFPEKIEFTNWAACERLLAHARSVVAQIAAEGLESEGTARLFHQTAWYVLDRTKYAEAEQLSRHAVEIRHKLLGPDHEDTAASLNDLAVLCDRQGRYAEAEPLYERALAIREKTLGPDHPDTATSLNNLATLYDSQGRYAEAEPLYERALAIREKAFGPDHPHTASSLNNLAFLHSSQSHYAKAEPLYERALAIKERTLGPNHPDTATSLNNLAGLYSGQERDTEADPLYKRALAILQMALGPEHPRTAASLNNLAWHYRNQGLDSEAKPLYERALAIREKALGPDHPDTANSLNSLATLFAKKGHFRKADALLSRALAIFEKTLGLRHPTTLQTARSYANVLQKLNRGHAAHKLRQRFGLSS